MGDNTLVYSALLLVKNVSKIYLVMYLVVIDFHIKLIFDEKKRCSICSTDYVPSTMLDTLDILFHIILLQP